MCSERCDPSRSLYLCMRATLVMIVVIMVWLNDNPLYGAQPETVLLALFLGMFAAAPAILRTTPERATLWIIEGRADSDVGIHAIEYRRRYPVFGPALHGIMNEHAVPSAQGVGKPGEALREDRVSLRVDADILKVSEERATSDRE